MTYYTITETRGDGFVEELKAKNLEGAIKEACDGFRRMTRNDQKNTDSLWLCQIDLPGGVTFDEWQEDLDEYEDDAIVNILDYLSTFEIRLNSLMEVEEFHGTLEEAEKQADEGICYNQQDASIYYHGKLAARRAWVGCLEGIDDNDDPIQFGDFGYYADWEEE